MAIIKPFKALRPPVALAEKVAALPYDVMNTEEARAMAAFNRYSFLHVSRPEIDLPSEIDIHSEPVYEKGRDNLSTFVSEGVLVQDSADSYYIYRQIMGAVVQTGLVVCSGVDDYQQGIIKKHELTRADKEEDRVRHIDVLDANDEPVFYTYRHDSEIDALMKSASSGTPEYDFTTDDKVRHTLWVVNSRELIDSFTSAFARIPTLYVADGHHRSAAASRVRDLRRDANQQQTGSEEYNYFLTVIFPDSELNIMPYNRAVKDLNGHTVAEFMAHVSRCFEVTPLAGRPEINESHKFGMYLASRWYELSAREESFDSSDPVGSLDVSILQNNILSPVLGIRNPRTDQRIHFVGGIRGDGELEQLVESGEYEVAFSLYHTTIDELMKLADVDKIMPPKSTWFEPKLRSGLFVHLLS
ncbi:MAG: DUF1015 domain-containing protein [Geobacteraceae bacterium]|nr:DUF1015 domain-containing protein [Geobacteraceae bacterium]